MDQFLEFVATIFGVEKSEINGETRFKEYEPWTSLMHLRLVMEVESRYDADIPIDEVPKIKTLNDLYSYVK